MTLFRSLLGVLLLLLLGISAGSAYPPRTQLEVDYHGCRAVLLPGLECVLGSKRKLLLWVRASPDSQIEIRADEERIEADVTPDGQSYSLRIPQRATRLYVLVEATDGRAFWSLPFAERKSATSRDLLDETYGLMLRVDKGIRARQLVETRKALDSLRLPPKAPAEALFLLSFYRSQLTEREGNYRLALPEIQKAADLAERLKLSQQVVAKHQLALLLQGLGRFRESARLFDQLRQSDLADPCERARLFNNQAWSTLLAREAGERFGNPTALLEKSLETYKTCKDFRLSQRVNILINLALAHLQEGRLLEAETLLIQAQDLEPNLPVPLRLWWLDLKARIALRESQPLEALHLFDDLQGLALITGSSDGGLRAALGKAQSQEALGDRKTALETLREAETQLDEQSLQIPLQEGRETFMATRYALVSLHLELLVRQGQTTEAFDVARHSRSRMLRQLKRGNRMANLTQEQRERWERFSTEYQEKRAALEERAKNDWRIPLDRRNRELAGWEAERKAMQKALDQAFQVFEDPGEQPDPEPPPPRPGELILAYHPLPSGWIAFAAEGKSVTAHRFGLPPDILSRSEEEQSRLLLPTPFHASIKRATKIRILPTGILQKVDFHALPFNGDVLLATNPVVYGLDLPVPAETAPASGRRALLVADPREDLQGALLEAQAVKRILGSSARPWITEELKESEASSAAMMQELVSADLLHYAGHGTFSGFGGWESSLLLAEETQLTLGDILALQRVPAMVVLSGCETGRSSNETPVESLSLAHAFLLSGSQAVIASSRKVNDHTVPDFFTDFYRRWDHEPDRARALQRAQLSWRQRNPKADWKAFRLFEP